MNDKGEPLEIFEEEIGSGSYGTVFLLKNHNPPAVVKYMHPREGCEETFQNELKALEKMTHPNIVEFFGKREKETDVGVKTGLVMEFCQRGTLQQLIDNPAIIYHIYTTITWARDLYSALQYIWIFNFIHRDISPSNILITEDFIVKIGDFGCNKNTSKTCSGTVIGTHRYMNPPCLIAEENKDTPRQQNLASHKNDVYSLGLVIWEMIERRKVLSEYGIRPFLYEDFIFDYIQKTILEIVSPTCHENIQKIIAKALQFDRNARPKAEEISFAFEEIIAEYDLQFKAIAVCLGICFN